MTFDPIINALPVDVEVSSGRGEREAGLHTFKNLLAKLWREIGRTAAGMGAGAQSACRQLWLVRLCNGCLTRSHLMPLVPASAGRHSPASPRRYSWLVGAGVPAAANMGEKVTR